MMYKKFMLRAIEISLNDQNEVPVGCIVVHDGRIISEASNRVEKYNNSLLHAEMIAIYQATRKLNSKFLTDCIMFCTMEPCDMCKAAIRLSRIKEVIFGVYQNDLIKSKCTFIGGICEEKCKANINQFFLMRRNKI
ncbi:MAG: nucleoside deaminase [Alphaproteobacteria bacterium]|nr:MAG: nucleoside deaminase [Alphaproteobacteria bacterium]